MATVNRRFAAPETGYVSRIEVPQEAFTNRAFTLYLKTRNPVVYAMIPFGLDDLESRSWVGLQGPRWRFHYDVARINPYGGREMEQDRRTGRIYSEIRNDALHAFLIDHRLAPKPDITARLYNDSKRKVLEDQRNLIGEEERALRRKMEELQEKQGHDHEVGQNLKVMQDELYRFLPRYRAIDKELKRLDEEAHTLNLPEEKRGNME